MYNEREYGIPIRSTAKVLFHRNFQTDFEGLLAHSRTICSIDEKRAMIIDVYIDSDNYSYYTEPQIVSKSDINFDEELFESLSIYARRVQDETDDRKAYCEATIGQTSDVIVRFDTKDMTLIDLNYVDNTFLYLYIDKSIIKNSKYIRGFIKQVEDGVETITLKMNSSKLEIENS